MLAAKSGYELLGGDGSAAFQNFLTDLSACAAGPLNMDFDSTVTGSQAITGGQTIHSGSSVSAQQMSLSFDPQTLAYTGSGSLNYLSHSYSVDWNQPGASDCSSGVGNPGSITAKGEFDLNALSLTNVINSLRIHLTLTPEVSESDSACLILMGVTQTVTVTNSDYVNYFCLAHGGTVGESAPPDSPYFLGLNTPTQFNPSGSSTNSGVTFNAAESSTITLTQTGP